MIYKIQLSSGVNVAVNKLELSFLHYLKKSGRLSIDKLNSRGNCVIKTLLSKGILIRTKKGNHVDIQLRAGINLPKNQ